MRRLYFTKLIIYFFQPEDPHHLEVGVWRLVPHLYPNVVTQTKPEKRFLALH